MMYPFLTLADETEITHSEMKSNGTVKVYIETPDESDGFHSAVYWLPEFRWEDIHGYSGEEIEGYKGLLKNNVNLIMELSKKDCNV